MKQFYMLVFLVGLQFSVFGQSDATKNLNEPFVYLKNGTLISADKVTYNLKPLSKDFIIADDKRYEIKNVKFYQDSNGFYANSKKYQVGNFLKRQTAGNANIYSFTGSGQSTTYSQGGMSTTSPTSKVTFFYNTEFNDLKKLKYSNLKVDFINHPDAMLHVNKFKKTRTIKRSLLIGGVALMLSTVLTADSSINGLAAGSATVGAASLLTGVFWGMNRDKHLYNAVNTYNGFDSF
jgi:hypothetical protein